MKKIGLYMTALLSMGLVACNQDFMTEFLPQTNLQESLLQTSDVTVANTTPATINLANYISEDGISSPIPIGTATVKEGAMPANTILKATVEFAKDADFANSVVLDANSLDGSNEISVSAAQLQDAYFNDITRNPATTDLFIRTVLYTVTGGTAEAIVGKPGENYYAQSTVNFTPLNKVQISPAYYIIGAFGGWSVDGARSQQFQHSDADVYEDPIFTVTVDTGGDDCWFAIADDTSLDAIASDNNWNQLFGTKGASEDLTGTMDRRVNLGGDHSFHVTGAKKIRVTLNMMEYSYTIEPINVADAYYLVGGPEDWAGSAASKSQKFSHSDASIADDPVFTYMLKGTGGDIWFAIGDDEACDAIANDGNWTMLYGTTSGNGQSGLSGSLARRTSLSDDGSFKVDGTADFYRISINMAELTYEITPINIAAEYYVVGGVQGWSDKDKTCLFTPEEQKNVLSYTTKWTGAWDLKVWDAEHFGTWDDAWGCAVDGDNSPSGALLNSGAQAISAPSAEFYTFTIDMNTQTYTWTKLDNQAPTEYESISLIGEFNGWGDDFDLVQVTPHNWYGVFTQEADGQLKYRANHDWSVNWGYGADKDWNVADGFNKIGTNGGGNIFVPAGTYAVYLNDITDSMLIIAQ